jgi:SAM-dependent methyltransferase
MSQETIPVAHHQRILQMAWGFAPTAILHAGVESGLFAQLAQGPRRMDELLAAMAASPRGLPALVNALVGLGLVCRQGDRYALAPDTATFLTPDSPAYLGPFFRHICDLVPTWLKLDEAVRTGRPPRQAGAEDGRSEAFGCLAEALFAVNWPGTQILAQHLAPILPATRTILDVAAGSGVWSISLAERAPRAQVTAVDWAEVLATTRRFVTRAGLANRYRFVGGDALEADFGQGYDIAVLGHILHSEGEDRSRRLLRRVFDALAPGGTIAIAEWLVAADRGGPAASLIFAVNMLLLTESGTTWSFDEIAGWLRDIGFVEPAALDAPGPGTLLLARKPG